MGDNVYLGDRNGVRTPMQWSADRNAGFSRANPQRLILPIIIDPEYHYEALNVEAQQNNPNSLLWWTKRLIALRKRFQRVRPRHASSSSHPANPRVLAFVRQLRGRDDPGGREPVALRAVRRARSRAHEGDASRSSCSAARSSRRSASCRTCSRSAGTPSTGSRSSRRPADDGAPSAAALPTCRRCSRAQRREPAARRGARRARGALPGVPRHAALVRRARASASPAPASSRRCALGDVYVLIARVEYADREPERYVLPLAVVPDGARRRAATPCWRRARTRAAGRRRRRWSTRRRTALGARALLDALPRRRRAAGAGGDVEATPFVGLELARRRAGQHQRRSTPRPPSATAIATC